MSDFETTKRSTLFWFAFFAVIITVVLVIAFYVLPFIGSLGVVALEGSAPALAKSIDTAVEFGSSSTTPLWLKQDSFMLQIYCTSKPEQGYKPCPPYFSYLYRKGKALEDSVKCNNSFCICLGTFNKTHKPIIPVQRKNDLNVSNKVFYVETSYQEPEHFLRDVYEQFFDSEKRILKINCYPINTTLVVDDYECEDLGNCHKNIFTYMYANGTYSFSSFLHKSYSDTVKMKVVW